MRRRSVSCRPACLRRDPPQPDRDRDRHDRASCARAGRASGAGRSSCSRRRSRAARTRSPRRRPRPPASRSRDRIRNGIEIAVKMMIPPIVGVPAFAWWPSGPSSRMCWPNSRSRRNAMNFGRQEDADEQRGGARDQDLAHATAVPRRRSASATTSRPTPRDALTSTVSPGCEQARHERRGRRGVGDARASRRRTPRAMCAARGPTVTSRSTPRSRGVRADLRVEAALVGPELEHVAEHRDAAPAPRSRRGRRGRRASTSGWRCSSRR